MSYVEGGDKVFRDYYNQLLEHPEQAIQSEEARQIINNTFEALGSLNMGERKKINIKGKSIELSELSEKEIIIFSSFIEVFSQRVNLPKEEAQLMIDNIISAQSGLQKIINKPDMHLENAKLQLHEKIEAPEKMKEDLATEAKNRIDRLLISEQKNVDDLEKKFKDAKIKKYLMIAAFTGVAIVGLAGFFALSVLHLL